jgi:site-specific DNA-cytosine methylase
MEMKDSRQKLTFIDLFAGCGGLSLGVIKTRFAVNFSVGYKKDAFVTLKHNLIDESNEYFVKFGISGFDLTTDLRKLIKHICFLEKNERQLRKSKNVFGLYLEVKCKK